MNAVVLAAPGGLKVHRDTSSDLEGLKELLDKMDAGPPGTVKWLHMESPAPEMLDAVWERSGFHPLELDDVRYRGHTPKIDLRPEHLFAVWYGAQERSGDPAMFEMDAFMGDDYLVTITDVPALPLDSVIDELASGTRVPATQVDMLFYDILVELTDSFIPVLEAIDDQIEDIEESVLAEAQDHQLATLFAVKRQLTSLKKVISPQREIASKLTWSQGSFIREESRFHFSDVHDRMIMVMDMLETSRDLASSAVDLYMTTASNRLNLITTRLTIIATIFLPLTFVAGVYGMNFEAFMPGAMPEFHIPYFYALLWLMMFGLGAGLLIYFKKRRWF